MEKEAASFRLKKREDDMFEKEDGEETPKENGDQRSNGIGADAKSDRSTDRQPDVVDDHPGKSRSTFHTSHLLFMFTDSSRSGILFKVDEQESKYES